MPPRASGVVPNVDAGDLGRWVRSEDLHAANMRRGAERTRGELRAMVENEGLDPAASALPEPLPAPEEPPIDDLDALAAYAEEQAARAEVLIADAKAREGAARDAARRF